MKIVKDLLPNNYKMQLQEILLSESFPWYWNESTKREVYGVKQNIFHLGHVFVEDDRVNSEYFRFIEPMYSYLEQAAGIKIKNVVRVKTNLLPKQPYSEEDVKNAIHVDMWGEGYVSFVYYLHDVDGDIKTYDDDYNVIDSYSPKENSVVYFNSNTLHGARPPTQFKRRVCINFVLGIHD
jgi:hypothetical protein